MKKIEFLFPSLRSTNNPLTEIKLITIILLTLFAVISVKSSFAKSKIDYILMDKKKVAKNIESGAPGIRRVWVVDDGEKIKQEDITNPLATSPQNPVWNGSTVNLFGAKNEIVAFQLILQADSSGAKNINVKLYSLTNGSYTISNSLTSADDPFNYIGKRIELFTEHYMHVTKHTEPAWFYHPNAKPSDYYLGWVPDALVPFEAPSGKGGVPFDITPNLNQGVWVDIWIPRDAPIGFYRGNIRVTVNKQDLISIPIELKVCNFCLPDEFHAHNMFYIEPSHIAKVHGTENQSIEYYAIETKYRQMAHRHHIDIVSPVPNLAHMDTYDKMYLTGEMFTKSNKYDGPGEGIGNKTFSIGIYGKLPDEYKWSQEGWWRGSDAWEEWFLKNAPLVERHKYLKPDEPVWNKGVDSIITQGKWSRSNPGVGRNIPCFSTVSILPELKDYIDFWSTSSQEACPPKTIDSEVSSERSAGKKWGFYNGFRPASGSVILDADAIEFRVQPWIMWKYQVDQYYYWETTYWREDMFSNPGNMSSRYFGDGTMFYPGQNVQYTDQDRGLAGPFSSIRMKNWRRGAQDYEYLWLLQQAGLKVQATAIADSCIHRALWEVDLSKNIPWSNHGYGFEKFRKQMASMLDSLATISKK